MFRGISVHPLPEFIGRVFGFFLQSDHGIGKGSRVLHHEVKILKKRRLIAPLREFLYKPRVTEEHALCGVAHCCREAVKVKFRQALKI